MIRIVSIVLSLVVVSNAHADDLAMTLSATTSTQLSGLFDSILPTFKAASNISVHVVAVDPGQAAVFGERGDADALLLDDRPAADKIVANGDGVGIQDAIYDDFVIVGPRSDPAGIRGFSDAGKAFAQIAAKGALFASRGDDGDAGRMERRLWKAAGIQPDKATAWYRSLGQDMAATLNAAATMNAYTLADRVAWANFKNRENLEIMIEGDAALLNIYRSIIVSPGKWPGTRYMYARIWHGWLTDKHGFAAITSYKINGEQIFFPCQGSAQATCRSAAQK